MFYISEYFNLFTVFFFLIGAVLGSFANVCIYRIPEGTFFKFPGKSFWESQQSCCRHCNTPIKPYYNIPILGYLLLLGKTSCCKKPLSPQYPIVEILTALAFSWMFIRFPFLHLNQVDLYWAVDTELLAYFIHGCILFYALMICSFIDLRLMIIPDVISIPMIIIAPIWVYFLPGFELKDCLLGILLGGGVLMAISMTYYMIKKQVGLGFGDVKFLAGIGGWLGYQCVFPTIMFASLMGSVIGIAFILIRKKGMQTALPFGPFLAIGALIYWVCGPELIQGIFMP